MLKDLSNLAQLLKQASRMRGEWERIGEELKQEVFEGSAGGGMVKVRINGKLEVLDCKIEPQVLSDRDTEMLEDLIVAAFNQALEKLWTGWTQKMGEVFGQTAGGLNIPGLSEMLGQFGGKGPGS